MIRLDTIFGDIMWLTRASPFINWGERDRAKAFRSKAAALSAIVQLRPHLRVGGKLSAEPF
jgi:hypothetical protein